MITASSARRERMVMVPPFGIASTALKMRFVTSSRSSASLALIGGSFSRSSSSAMMRTRKRLVFPLRLRHRHGLLQ